MNDQPLRIAVGDTTAEQDDRFHRFRLISWWDQDRLRDARVLVIGAGALGNELVKNLALLGVGNVLVADMDRVENSNLSRSVLYRARDNGQLKATAAARAAKEIYPDLNAHAFNGNVVYDLGLGVFRWADVILGGLDNREARLAINRACWRVNRPWIDGAIEAIQGTARVFVPDGPAQAAPCYECTMSETDWRLLNLRRSCNLLTRQEMQDGKTPTTPTISSIIAGVQTQEAVKLLHGLESFPGKGWVFAGLSADSYHVEFQRKADCYSHEPLDEIIALDERADTLTVCDLLALARGLAYGLVGTIIAFCLAIAEPLVDRNVQGVTINGAVGAMLGLFGGVIVSLFVDRLHQWAGGSDATAQATGQEVLANAVKYGVVGLFLTIAPGVLMRNFKKLGVGLVGGVIGGVIGGLPFAPVAQWSGSTVVPRAVATVAIGLIAGLATGLIENAAKTGWLKVVQGFIAGKQFILYRATTYIGASPDCHIYLFKDPAIGRRHAAVHIVPGGFDLEDLPLGGATLVNGRRITRHRLRAGDQIQVGRTAFTFREKTKQ